MNDTNQVLSSSAVAQTNVTSRKQARSYALDGTNLMRRAGSPDTGMATLLTVAINLSNHASDLLCIFDATTVYWLQKGSEECVSMYNNLLQRHPRHFYQCTIGATADDFILAEADFAGAIVVSNDAFRNYKGNFPWITDDARILRVNRIREHVYIGPSWLDLITDLRAARAELDSNLQRLKAA